MVLIDTFLDGLQSFWNAAFNAAPSNWTTREQLSETIAYSPNATTARLYPQGTDVISGDFTAIFQLVVGVAGGGNDSMHFYIKESGTGNEIVDLEYYPGTFTGIKVQNLGSDKGHYTGVSAPQKIFIKIERTAGVIHAYYNDDAAGGTAGSWVRQDAWTTPGPAGGVVTNSNDFYIEVNGDDGYSGFGYIMLNSTFGDDDYRLRVISHGAVANSGGIALQSFVEGIINDQSDILYVTGTSGDARVGILTPDPQATLHVNGTVKASDFSGDLTGDVTGNADTATLAATSTIANEATDTTCFPLFVTAATGSLALKTNTALTLNSNTGALGITTVELGHASDTTLSRSSAGVLAVEGVVIPSISSTNTLTNKRITPRVSDQASSATPTINTDNVDAHSITALATAITSMTTNLSGTPTNFQKLIIRIKDNGTARAIAWGASFEARGVALPTTTVLSKVLTVGFIYNTVSAKWGCVASAQEA